MSFYRSPRSSNRRGPPPPVTRPNEDGENSSDDDRPRKRLRLEGPVHRFAVKRRRNSEGDVALTESTSIDGSHDAHYRRAAKRRRMMDSAPYPHRYHYSRSPDQPLESEEDSGGEGGAVSASTAWAASTMLRDSDQEAARALISFPMRTEESSAKVPDSMVGYDDRASAEHDLTSGNESTQNVAGGSAGTDVFPMNEDGASSFGSYNNGRAEHWREVGTVEFASPESSYPDSIPGSLHRAPEPRSILGGIYQSLGATRNQISRLQGEVDSLRGDMQEALQLLRDMAHQ
ncbi:hypothetical protein FOMPIDRAFT_1050649 [Fomitopsis schrenkii]|uniref:Uncharacterized protein n=1 Tax=Fomitopsis schrenkii TaxID=2126942 RepID=S8FM35_FOMSC|nr:hypothetical protein FOMPIDRAFT_1050649 [Fomitopsis schrenkii]